MALFTGTHINKLDAKGRVSVPKQFRACLNGQDFRGIYVFRSYRAQALDACGEGFMERIAASLDSLDLFSEEQDDLATTILADAHQLPFDGEGRIVLPRDLIDHAGLDGQVAFVGLGRTFQLWAPDTFAAHQAAARNRARHRGATLKLGGADAREAQP